LFFFVHLLACRLESCVSPQTRLRYCTTGMLLRRLEGDGGLLRVVVVGPEYRYRGSPGRVARGGGRGA
jgi:hypothetical protein